MRQIVSLALILVFLTGCSSQNSEMERVLEFRQTLLQSEGVSFRAEVTADYGDSLASFSLDYQADPSGNVRFCVSAPETIQGIAGALSEEGGKLTFDDTVLYFDPLTEELLNPVSAGWILVRALRGGCITSVGMEEDLLRLSVDDSYEDDALRLDIWMDPENRPVQGDILWDGRRILSLTIQNFTLM